MQQATLRVHKADGSTLDLPIVVRNDTPVENTTTAPAASCLTYWRKF